MVAVAIQQRGRTHVASLSLSLSAAGGAARGMSGTAAPSKAKRQGCRFGGGTIAVYVGSGWLVAGGPFENVGGRMLLLSLSVRTVARCVA